MRIHVSIDVDNVTQSVEFYSKLFGVKPQKQTQSYAKFDLEVPPFNFSMQSNKGKQLSKVNHFGIEVNSTEQIEDWQKRLEELGVSTQPETNTNCCYARQDKIWVSDPDYNSWEIFFVHEQLSIPREIEKEKRSSCGPSQIPGAGCC